MTVSSTINRTSAMTVSASTQVIAVPFQFLQITDLVVQLKLSYTPFMVLTIPYSATTGGHSTGVYFTAVTGTGNLAGGSITLTVDYGSLAAGNTVYVTRVPDQLQAVAYVDGSPFPASTHETALDKLTMEVQYLNRRINYLFTKLGYVEDIS